MSIDRITQLRARLHAQLEAALELNDEIDALDTTLHPMDSAHGMIKGARTANESRLSALLKLKRETPARP